MLTEPSGRYRTTPKMPDIMQNAAQSRLQMKSLAIAWSMLRVMQMESQAVQSNIPS